jgi:hypothetical protein
LFIQRISQLFNDKHIPYAIVGGYAVAIHGVARGTFDLDIVTEVSAENFRRIEEALADIGMKSIIPVSGEALYANLKKFIAEKNLIAWHFVHPSKPRDSLDIIVANDMRDFEIIEVKSDFGNLPTLSLESLIRMKSQANREQDIKDVTALKHLRDKNL